MILYKISKYKTHIIKVFLANAYVLRLKSVQFVSKIISHCIISIYLILGKISFILEKNCAIKETIRSFSFSVWGVNS